MAAFEFGNYPPARGHKATPEPHKGELAHGVRPPVPQPVIEEPILAMKIYDSCRSKDCLGAPEIGPARHRGGGLIEAPDGAKSVLIEDLAVQRITVLRKDANVKRKIKIQQKTLIATNISKIGNLPVDC